MHVFCTLYKNAKSAIIRCYLEKIYMKNLKEILKNDQHKYVLLQDNEKEYVSIEDAALAYTIIKDISYKDVPDFYLGSASLNLLNTYVKQKDSLIDYRFKKYTKTLIETLANTNIDGIKMDLQIDKGMRLLMIQLHDEIQFSFHRPSIDNELFDKLHKKSIEGGLTFDGVRKQKCANTVFHNALKASCIDVDTLKNSSSYITMKNNIESLKLKH